MTEHVEEHGAVEREGAEAPRRGGQPVEHWHGYPGEAEAETYGVPARARYGLLFSLMLLGLMLVAIAFMTMHDW
ncbi:MAG: hypothetical protein KF795_33030 [Labilithrix sp.]|nr:hypothetical protein [Labilithrix sp.]